MRYFLLLVLLVLFQGAAAQQDGNQPKVKVGLVLSGGGAKGIAHIGALKVIEEAGVHIDYIGGTSMGAIVGALYASGYSASELDSLFQNTDFTNLIQDNLPRSAKTFYEKDDAERYALTLPFTNFRISFPPAISSGQSIYNELVRLLYHVKDVRDFNKLPIPFFCIATDVETGEEVLLNKGYLPEAIMASGTFPSLFEPAEIDGQILIDGGVLNNYPIDEVKALGANFVIGVDVQHGLRNRESLLSATEVLLQINNYRTVGAMTRKSADTDIYIKPDIDNFSVIDFNLKETIVERGEKATRVHMDALQQLAARQEEAPVRPTPVPAVDSLTVNRLIITGNDNYTRGYVKGKLRFSLGEPTTFEKLQQGISNLAATNNFQTIRYKLISNGLAQDLIISLRETPNKTFLRMSAHYDDLYKSAALINITKKRFLFNDDVASFDLILGDNVRYNMQYYIDKGFYWSFGINSRFNEFSREINSDLIASNFDFPGEDVINTLTIDVSDFTNQAYVQTVLQEEFAFSLGVEHKFLKYSTLTLNQPAQESLPPTSARTVFEKSNYFSTYGKLTLDTYNDSYFPSRGLYFDGDFHLYLLSSDFNNNFKEFSIAKARMGMAFPIVPKLSVNLETEGGFKLGTSSVTALDFVLGGYGASFINNFVPFFGYDYLSLPGNSYVKAYARFDYEFAPKNHLLLATNIANVEDDLFRTGEWFTAPDYTGFAVGYGWQSFMGPVQAYYAWSPELGDGRFLISVGYWF
ncbi:patatin-like phospholipase family protein [Zeaxanthinibacter enoshimensis]|uniref:NTE family protein n=1 Tax=Zeaxanthinibacter enoshimensis TaxID=392009 RepID=A0A4R6TT60_9FLAO|nr:patatin-like phospholipase family protein [Zeaxanthinibacter enoshimensis]TDQ33089.1 NTE family protein [Zeaxanthinibacter enoshimensis]